MKLNKNNKNLIRIILATILLIFGFFANNINGIFGLCVYLSAFFISGTDIIVKAFKNIFRGHIFDENLLMSIATIGAFIVGEYPEGVAVMVFYQIGELFQSYAVNKSRKSISELMNIRPDYANLKNGEEYKKVDPEEVNIGDIILIKPGEKVPLDCMIVKGSSFFDSSPLTGESVPRKGGIGDEILSGCINTTGLISAKVIKKFEESTVSKILDLVENASSKKSTSENFITRFAHYYTPLVVLSAVIIGVIPPLFISTHPFGDWLYRALIFLVISCPCALVISIPLSFFGGLGACSKKFILVKGSNYLEALAKAKTVVFDKTGTLTKGVFEVQKIVCNGISEDDLLFLAAHVESFSNHPISISLQKAFNKPIDTSLISNTEELSGYGIKATINNKQIIVGNHKLLIKENIDFIQANEIGTIVYVAMDGIYLGYILIADKLKTDSKKAIKDLKDIGIKQTFMLTGDTKNIGDYVGKQLGIDKVYAELLPTDKVNKLEDLLETQSKTSKLVFVGDGINDAPVLARADIGIAMGGIGSDAAIEAADAVIMNDDPSKVATAIKISRRTLKIVKQNIVFALGVKFIVLALGAIGIATMWEAVFADVGVSVLAILNAVRILHMK